MGWNIRKFQLYKSIETAVNELKGGAKYWKLENAETSVNSEMRVEAPD